MSATPRRGVPSGPGDAARRLALDALLRIDQEGAYANLVLPGLLARSSLDQRDRGFVTELVYGTTRMRRACDWLVDRFVMRDLDPPTRMALRLGAYQLVFLDTPAHAAVSATVGVAPTRSRGLVNAVLRRVASAPRDWPDEGTRLSYPDWIIERLTTDLGEASAVEALEAMNERAVSVERDDGYHQDPASQWVAAEVCAEPGEVVLDLCAGPGGKATLLAATGALVVATDSRPARAGLVGHNASELGLDNVEVLSADGTRPPFVAASFDRVLVDAPCSGLGSLRRRADARWRIRPTDLDSLVDLPRRLLDSAAGLVRPGGTLVYSVCTLSDAETVGIDRWLEQEHPELVAVLPPGAPFEPHGRGALLLPQRTDAPNGPTDGMFLVRLTRSA
ncbi:MAG: transcription antitermination factor NusB [Acidimicrobiales bacterium]